MLPVGAGPGGVMYQARHVAIEALQHNVEFVLSTSSLGRRALYYSSMNACEHHVAIQYRTVCTVMLCIAMVILPGVVTFQAMC